MLILANVDVPPLSRTYVTLLPLKFAAVQVHVPPLLLLHKMDTNLFRKESWVPASIPSQVSKVPGDISNSSPLAARINVIAMSAVGMAHLLPSSYRFVLQTVQLETDVDPVLAVTNPFGHNEQACSSEK
jgi:hypothetical protein